MTFDDIIGQERALERLKGYIASQTVDAAYLFTGPAGIGKALTAVAFAKALNCLTPNAFGCGQCVSCRKIDAGSHPDVHVIDSSAGQNSAGAQQEGDSSQIKISAIRDLQENINYRPYEARVKVFIINNAQQLNPDAANAFLKTLEEPPPSSVIILVTDRPALLLPTIRSRCRVVKFYPMHRPDLERSLMRRFSGSDGCSAALAHFLAYFSEGSLGVALRLKEQGLFEEKNRIIDCFCGSAGETDDTVSLASRQDLLASFNILATWFRDMYLYKTGAAASELIHADRRDDIAAQATRYSFAELDRIMQLLSESVLHVERNLNKKLLVSNVIVACKQSRPAFA